MKKTSTIILTVLLSALFAFVLIPQAATAEDGGAGDQAGNAVEEPYMKVSFYDLSEAKDLSLSDEAGNSESDSVAASSLSDKTGVRLRGTAADLKSVRMNIRSEFVFDGNPVGRISLKGAADMGASVDAKVYLDDETEPAAIFRLDSGKAANNWAAADEQTLSVCDQKITGSHKVSIGFDIAGKEDSENLSIALKSIEFVEDPAIPTLYFNLDEGETTIADMNNSIDHSVRCTGAVDVVVPDSYTCEYEGDPVESMTGLELEYIRGRGNSTWGPDMKKKPYKFKLDSAANLFNMGANAHWVLLANYFDNSLVRNRMTYWLGAKMGMPFTPQCVPVDVVMNGEYYGSYLLAEQVRVGDKRVAIDKLKASHTTLPEISGGYLLRMSPYMYEDERSVFKTERGARFENDTPDFVEYENEQQKNYIRGYVQKVEDTIYGEDFKDSEGKKYTEYLDLDTAVDYWWIQEFSKNGDAYGTDSTYLYKPRNDKLYWGPIWDFDYVAWGNLEGMDDLDTSEFCTNRMVWFDKMLTDKEFTDKVEARYDDLDALITDMVKDGGIIDQYADEISISERYDIEKNGFYRGFVAEDEEDDEDGTYADEITQLKAWITQRQDWVGEHLDEISGLFQEVRFHVDDEVIGTKMCKGALYLGEEYTSVSKEGYAFAGWFTAPEGGEKVADGVELTKDTDLYAHFVRKEDASKATDLFFSQKEYWVELKDEALYLPCRLLPADALVKDVQWSSSDESIAGGMDGTFVQLHKTGTVTVTGTLPGGQSASCIIHVYDSDVTPPVEVKEIRFDEEEITLDPDEYAFNPFTVTPSDVPVKYDGYVYSIDNEDIAAVDDMGVVTGISPGKATVTITETGSEVTASYTVNVTGEVPKEKASTDEIDAALSVLLQMRSLVNKADYTSASYSRYDKLYSEALAKLSSGDVTSEEVSALRHSVISAQLALVKKKTNTMTVKAKTVKVKYAKVKKKAQKIKKTKAFTIRNAKGTLSFTRVAKGSSAKLKINKKTGLITVKKGTKKGLYKIKVKVKAAGNGTYKAKTKTVIVKVRVR